MTATNDTPVIHVTIGGQLDGYTVSVAFAGKIEQLPAAVKRLAAAGVQPSAAAAGAPKARKAPEVTTWRDDGTPICPVHSAPMKPSQHDGWYCTKKSDSGEYCRCRA